MTDEEYVRSKWVWVEVRCAEPYEGVPEGKWTARLPLEPFSQVAFNSEAEAWGALDAFTRAREKQIAEIEEEIAFVRNDVEGCLPESLYSSTMFSAYWRILASRIAAKAELQRGMVAEPREHEGGVKP